MIVLINRRNYPLVFCLTFIIFGAMSNLLDRLKYGCVICYLDLKYFTVFNLADIMIVGGALWLLILITTKNKKYEF